MKIVDIAPISVELSSEEAAIIGGGIRYNFFQPGSSSNGGGLLAFEANGGGGGGSTGGSAPVPAVCCGIRGLTITPTYQGFPQQLYNITSDAAVVE